jgi:transcriptional regulator with XRE-family HTH domain
MVYRCGILVLWGCGLMTRVGGWPDTGFAARLRALREARGWSQQTLAEKAGCRLETVSRLELGKQEPAWPLVLALGKALGVDCTAFQTPPEPPPAPDRPKARKPRRPH